MPARRARLLARFALATPLPPPPGHASRAQRERDPRPGSRTPQRPSVPDKTTTGKARTHSLTHTLIHSRIRETTLHPPPSSCGRYFCVGYAWYLPTRPCQSPRYRTLNLALRLSRCPRP
ncbi:hypothetical protein GGR56DRAFT_111658 [Xylariaceae sp. FL0804]|nr:hypothetical protein GGR56DRAFT_111658 [Xylariaceae sp. FL0804]